MGTLTGRPSSLYFEEETRPPVALADVVNTTQCNGFAKDEPHNCIPSEECERRDSGFEDTLEHKGRTLSLSRRPRASSESDLSRPVLPIDVLKAQYAMSPLHASISEDDTEECSGAPFASINNKHRITTLTSTSTQDSGYPDDEVHSNFDMSAQSMTLSPDLACAAPLQETVQTVPPATLAADKTGPKQDGTHLIACKSPNKTAGQDAHGHHHDHKDSWHHDNCNQANKANCHHDNNELDSHKEACVDVQETLAPMASIVGEDSGQSMLTPVSDSDSDTLFEKPSPLARFQSYSAANSRRASQSSTTSQSKRPVLVTDI